MHQQTLINLEIFVLCLPQSRYTILVAKILAMQFNIKFLIKLMIFMNMLRFFCYIKEMYELSTKLKHCKPKIGNTYLAFHVLFVCAFLVITSVC